MQPRASLRKAPDAGAEQTSELLFGEVVQRDRRERGWSQVRAIRDGYTGWIVDAAIAPAAIAASHRVSQPSGLVFARPDIKSPLLQRFYQGSLLALEPVDGVFHQVCGGGFIHYRHVSARFVVDSDPVAIGMRFVGTPYLWGGRTCDGIDCSALVQTALQACGIDCPRDTGDQRAAFGHAVVSGEPRRGDLVFFPGHVGMMIDGSQLLHANAFWMTTIVEPLAAVIDRLRPSVDQPILAVVRPA